MFGIETALEIRSKNAIPTKTHENGSFVLLYESGENERSLKWTENVHREHYVESFYSIQFDRPLSTSWALHFRSRPSIFSSTLDIHCPIIWYIGHFMLHRRRPIYATYTICQGDLITTTFERAIKRLLWNGNEKSSVSFCKTSGTFGNYFQSESLVQNTALKKVFLSRKSFI